jgi:hypothetical protein
MTTLKMKRILILATLVGLLAGCQPRLTSAPRSFFEPLLEVATYPAATLREQDLLFDDVQIFLWKPETQPNEVTAVIDSSLTVDRLTDETVTIKAEQKKLRHEFSEKSINVDETDQLVKDAVDRKKAFEEQLADVRTQLAREESRTPRNEAKVEQLRKKLIRLEEKIQEQDTAMADALEAVRAAGLEAAWAKWSTQSQRRGVIAEDLQRLANTISESVELFQPAKRVQFYPPSDGGAWSAEIESWDLGDGRGGMVYSTADGTIRNVAYAEVGGVFSFEVVTPDATFRFRLARARAGAPDGRTYLKGKVWRTSTDGVGPASRLGVAKIVGGGKEE